MAKGKATETRAIVLEILLSLRDDTQKVNVILRDVLKKYDYMDARDKAFIKRLTEGCVEQQILLDYVINCYSKTKTNKMKPVILTALRMGTYQILKMNSVPDSAACNETVNLVVSKGLQGLRGYVNGVMRSIARGKDTIVWPEENNEVQYLSVIYSMPEWIVEMWLARFGRELTEKILSRMQETSSLTVRISEHLSQTERDALVASWKESGMEPLQHPYYENAYRLKHAEGMERVSGFVEGKVTVQDASSILAVKLAGIGSNDLVLDVCAAPGGKSMFAAELSGNQGKVIARDLTESKTALIEENVHRQGLDNIEVQIRDAKDLDESMIGRADVVIADLPCSGLGVMGRKADIRYHCSIEAIRELAQLQRQILTVVQNYVKPGGILMYSTCTISEEENEENRSWFLEHFPFRAESVEEFLPEEQREITDKQGYRQLLPGIHECDGFFFAKFRRMAVTNDERS